MNHWKLVLVFAFACLSVLLAPHVRSADPASRWYNVSDGHYLVYLQCDVRGELETRLNLLVKENKAVYPC